MSSRSLQRWEGAVTTLKWISLMIPVACIFWAYRKLRRPAMRYDYLSPEWTRGARYERCGYDQ
jgi:hypothetical protein